MFLTYKRGEIIVKNIIEERVFLEAKFMLKNKCTIRSMVKTFNVSKSTIHYDLSKRLKRYNYSLFLKVDKILKFNLSQRHIRGGKSTKIKYFNKKA